MVDVESDMKKCIICGHEASSLRPQGNDVWTHLGACQIEYEARLPKMSDQERELRESVGYHGDGSDADYPWTEVHALNQWSLAEIDRLRAQLTSLRQAAAALVAGLPRCHHGDLSNNRCENPAVSVDGFCDKHRSTSDSDATWGPALRRLASELEGKGT